MESRINVWNFNSISTLVDKLFDFLLHKPRPVEKGKVHLPKFFAVLGAIISTFFLSLAIAAYLDEAIWPSVVLLAFSLLGASFIVAFINCRITFDEDSFTAKNFFGIKRNITYAQVTAIKENMHETYIYIDKHRVMVDEFSVGGIEFIRFVKRKYKATHNGKELPEIKTTKFDIFNGHVTAPAEILFGFILGSALVVGLVVMLACYTFVPSTVNNTPLQTVVFISCEIKNDEIVLTSTDDKLYKIMCFDEQTNIKALKSICNGKTSVTTYSDEVTPDDEPEYYWVKAIIHNDNYIFSFEENNRLHREESLPLVFFGLAILLLWVFAMIATVIVGRNPQKFSKRIIGLFFKNGYIKF